MRPVRLELEGFTAFRRSTTVAFDGADLFALTGPTGAGKTSIIDAMTFALYGAVPRLDERAVAPVISQGLAECRVRLDFTVGDEAYVAVRVVRATKSGATTREARLERADGTVVAGDAKSLTAEVTALLGLDFKQFTTCVSLPQGEFARFLHAEPRHRQDLLVRLLDLGLYEQVGQAARQRAALAGERVAVATARLGTLAWATPEARAAAESRVRAVEQLRELVAAAEPRLATTREGEQAARAAADAATASLELLGGVEVPDGVGVLAARASAAAEARVGAGAAEDDAVRVLADAELAVAALPDRAVVEAQRRDREEAARLAAQIATGERAVATAGDADKAAAAALDAARLAEAVASERLQHVRTADAAHALAASLHVGDDCPVCGQVIEALPTVPPDIETAEADAGAAADAVRAAVDGAAAAGTERARVEAKLAGLADQLAVIAPRLEGVPSATDLAVAMEALTVAERAVVDRRERLADARRARVEADRAAEAAARAVDDARRAYDDARDRVASLRPPAAERVDLAADWAALAAWAADRRSALLLARDAALAEVEEYQAAATAIVASVVESCEAAGIHPGDDPRGAVADALGAARSDVVRVDDAIAEVAGLQLSSAADRAASEVAGSLAAHLAANRFERWLLEEALGELVGGATRILLELSGHAYSLAVDDKGAFLVIDHVNADQVRTARTLSGGETFLASLALALALADQVAGLAVGGAARLETILLDEGFGTLDPEALDTVAAALEELGSRGRTVGVVTHVRELAERLPVRFEVRKIGGSATVDRVTA